MSIDIQRPGTFFSFSFTSRAGGFTPLSQKIALIGVQTVNKKAPGTLTRILGPEEAEQLHGRSELALMARAAFAVGAERGMMPRVYTVPMAETSGPTAAATVTDISITGVPIVTGSLVMRIAGRSLRVGVSPVSTAAQIAEGLGGQLANRASDLPVAGSVQDAKVTCTHNWKGASGNAVRFEAVEIPAGLSVDITTVADGVGESDPTEALDATIAHDFDAVALPNPTAANIGIAQAHVTEAWAQGTKMWRLAVFGTAGTLADAQSLASINDYRMVIAAHRNARSLSSEIAATVAALAFSDEAPNFNYDDAALPIYGADAADAWTVAEVEALLAAGVTPLAVNDSRADRVTVSKLVTTQVATNDVPDYTKRDIVVPKVAAFVARQIANLHKKRRPKTTTNIRDMVLDVNRSAEGAGYIRNVEALRTGLTVTPSDIVPGRSTCQNPIEIVIPQHQAEFLINAVV